MTFRDEVVSLVTSNRYRSAVEIGVWRGELSRMLYEHVDRLILVDPWSAEWNRFDYGGMVYECTMGEPVRTQRELDQMYHDVKASMPSADVMRLPSTEAADLIDDASVDFVFIDAIHTYESCRADILAWLPKIRKGGMIAGDDYYPPHRAVSRAVDELLGVSSDRVWHKRI